ncbi:helix-turn-helix transcriptional regulator [Longispora sp. K20-0274]|uniref:AraC family transcriptional regulator n=1 Tax=Longispora sp. K20-0274 TaxID=3088255 RepID=UPI003999F6EC
MSKFGHDSPAPTLIRRLAPGALVRSHRHGDHQIVYAAAGVLSVATDRGTWIAPATRAIWVPAGTPHEHRAYGRTDLHVVGLPVADNPLGLTDPAVLSVEPLLRELIIAYTGGPPTEGPERDRLRAVLLDRLARSAEQPLRLPTARDTRLTAIGDILTADPADDRTLAEFGARVGASERTLSRLLRAELAMTFPQWRTQLRLHRALILLAEGVAVTTVAHRCGWASASAFIDVFRRTFGHTPGRHGA